MNHLNYPCLEALILTIDDMAKMSLEIQFYLSNHDLNCGRRIVRYTDSILEVLLECKASVSSATTLDELHAANGVLLNLRADVQALVDTAKNEVPTPCSCGKCKDKEDHSALMYFIVAASTGFNSVLSLMDVARNHHRGVSGERDELGAESDIEDFMRRIFRGMEPPPEIDEE